jgi:archaellum component FlaC
MGAVGPLVHERAVKYESNVATKKSPAKRAARSPAARGEDALRARDVLLEHIESQMQVVVEAVSGIRERLDTKLNELEARLSQRIEILEQVVRQNSEDIRKNSEDIRKNSEDIRKNSEDIEALRAEVAQLRRDFEHRAERARMDSIEARVTRIEEKLGMAS